MTQPDVAVTAPRFPPGRYGRRREPRSAHRWQLWAAIAAAVVAGLVVAVVLYQQFGEHGVQSQVLRWNAVTTADGGNAVRIEFQVSGHRGTRYSCVVRARGRDGSEVGRASVPVAAGDGTVTETAVLRTNQPPVTGELDGCAPG